MKDISVYKWTDEEGEASFVGTEQQFKEAMGESLNGIEVTVSEWFRFSFWFVSKSEEDVHFECDKTDELQVFLEQNAYTLKGIGGYGSDALRDECKIVEELFKKHGVAWLPDDDEEV